MIKRIIKTLNKGQFYAQAFKKTAIFLHHTAGTTASGAWEWWNQTEEAVGTAFMIDRDGTIIQCYNPAYWAWHLGITGDDNYYEKQAIGIEIVSAGELTKVKTEFFFYPSGPTKKGTKIPKEDVEKIGDKYYHRYTDAQLEALSILLPELKTTFQIEMQGKVKDITEITNYKPDVWKKKISGIWSHSTVRKDKVDIYPTPRLLAVLNSVL